MKEARHIATGKTVRAAEADYEGFYGIYECPSCKSVLFLRKGHIRGGQPITPAFIHLQYETEEQMNCPERIPLDFGDKDSVKNSPESKGQFYKKLKKNFLKCLKKQSGGIKEYYKDHKKSSEETLNYIDSLINLSNKILGNQNGKYILDLESSGKIRNLFIAKIYNRINSFPAKSIQRKIQITCLQSYLDSVKGNCNSLIWGIEFLINEADENFRKEVLNYILGKYAFSGEIEGDLQILGLEYGLLMQTDKVLSDNKLINSFFQYMYSNEALNNGSVNFEQIKIFHNKIFDYIINYLVDFNWYCL
jgi:hypothetical protein